MWRVSVHRFLPAALPGRPCYPQPGLREGRPKEDKPRARDPRLRARPVWGTPCPSRSVSRSAPARPPRASLLPQRARASEVSRRGPREALCSAPENTSGHGCYGLASVSLSVHWGCVTPQVPSSPEDCSGFEERVPRGFQRVPGDWRRQAQRVEGKTVLTSPLALACSLPRALSGRLRLGLAEQSVLAALAQAVSLTPPGQGEAPQLSPPGARVSPGCPPFPKSTPQLLSRPFPSLAALSPAPPALGEPRGRAHPKASAGGSGLRFPPGCRGRWEGPDSGGPEEIGRAHV